MKKTKYFKQAVATIMAATFFMPTVAMAATGSTITKQKQFVSQTNDFHYDFAKTITENGKQYQLDEKSVTYQVVNNTESTAEHKVTIKGLYNKEDAKIKETVTVEENGDKKVYKHKDTEYQDTVIKNRTELVTATTDFDYAIKQPVAPTTKNTNYTDQKTGQVINCALSYKSMNVLEDWHWKNDVSIPVTFKVYDSDYYKLGTRYVPYNDNKPALKGYEKDMINYLNLSAKNYKITGVQWSGKVYTKNGVQYRNAIATGSRYVAKYQAVYESTVSLPDCAGFNAVARYTIAGNDQQGYTVLATATYNEIKNTVNPVVIIAAVVILALLLVLILYFAAKKRKQK